MLAKISLVVLCGVTNPILVLSSCKIRTSVSLAPRSWPWSLSWRFYRSSLSPERRPCEKRPNFSLLRFTNGSEMLWDPPCKKSTPCRWVTLDGPAYAFPFEIQSIKHGLFSHVHAAEGAWRRMGKAPFNSSKANPLLTFTAGPEGQVWAAASPRRPVWG